MPVRAPSSEPAPRSFRLVATAGPQHPDEYLAEDDGGNRIMLILVAGDERPLGALRADLEREAQILARLRHPGCVAPLAVVEIEDRVALLTEAVDDADLDRVVSALEQVEERFPARAALDVGAQLADALRAAHTAEIDERPHPVVHGNLEPSNVRLTGAGQVRVVRFGVGRARRPRPRAAVTGLVPAEAWRSPEGVLGADHRPAGDVFAAALITAELVAGRRLGPAASRLDAHDGWSRAVTSVVAGRLGGAPGADAVADILRRCLAWRLEDRPSAAELANALDAAAREMPGEDLAAFALRFLPRVEGIAPRVEQPTTGILVEGTPPRPPQARRPARPAIWAAVLVPLAAASALCGGAATMSVTTWAPSLVRGAASGPARVEVAGATQVVVRCPGGHSVAADGPVLELEAAGRGRCSVAATLGGREHRGPLAIGPGVTARCALRAGGLDCGEHGLPAGSD